MMNDVRKAGHIIHMYKENKVHDMSVLHKNNF
jgi:hypothetical protein